MCLVLSCGNTQGQFSHRVHEDVIPLFPGGHFLGNAPDHLFHAEGFTQHGFTGDAVEDRDQRGLRSHQMAAGLYGGGKARKLHSEEQYIHRLCDGGGVGVIQITPRPIVPHAVPEVTRCPLPVCQHQHMVLAQRLGQCNRIQCAKGAQTDDADGLDFFHKKPLL